MQLIPKGSADELQSQVDASTTRQEEISSRAAKAIQQFKAVTARKAKAIQVDYAEADRTVGRTVAKLARGR